MVNAIEKLSIKLPFCGFYESHASAMIDDEIEQAFDYSDGGGRSNTPWPNDIDYHAVQVEFVKAYVDGFADRFEGETGIALQPEFEEMTSPREYNFETDRVFISVPVSVVAALFTESEKDNHVKLAEVINGQCTSYDGFISFYSNDLGNWLAKPVFTWDHNELGILLQAVAAIHCDTADWNLWDLMERWTCNGGLSDAVRRAMSKELCDFADLQRDYGQAVDYDLWKETGKAYPEGTKLDDTTEVLPEPRCKETIEMRF